MNSVIMETRLILSKNEIPSKKCYISLLKVTAQIELSYNEYE